MFDATNEENSKICWFTIDKGDPAFMMQYNSLDNSDYKSSFASSFMG